MNDRNHKSLLVMCAVGVLVVTLMTGVRVASAEQPAVPAKPHTISTISSTVPANGDVNPYGIFRIPRTAGNLKRGNILISNFNNSSNLQGTGTTLVEIAPNGDVQPVRTN